MTNDLRDQVDASTKRASAAMIRLVMTKLDISAAQLARRAGIAPSTITRALDPNIRFTPSARTMARIGAVAGGADPDAAPPLALRDDSVPEMKSRLRRVPVLGEVRAGAWLEIAEDPEPSEWVFVDDDDYQDTRLFALRVIGSSMDQVYPEGTIVIAADAVGASVFDGDIVVVRRQKGPLVETTLKEIEASTPGRFVLWPRSSDAAHQDPIVIERDEQADEGPQIIGVVIASYARRQRKSRRIVDFEN
jgi:SOS-response transcriptional repressor LexA